MRYILFIFLASCQSLKNIPQDRILEINNTKTIYNPDRLYGEAWLPSTATPYILEDLIIAGNAYDGVKAYNLNSGRLLWKKTIRNGIESGFTSDDKFLYFGGNDYTFYAVYLDNGRESWSFLAEGEISSTPTLHGDKILFLTANNVLYALNKQDGSLIWRYRRPIDKPFSVRGAASPVIHNQRVYIGFSDGFFTAIDLNNGSLIWERQLSSNKKFVDIDSTAVIDEDSIYVSSFDDRLYSLNLANGSIRWLIEEGGSYPVILSGRYLFHVTNDGKALRIEKSSGKIENIISETSGIFRKPTLTNEFLILGSSEGAIYFYDLIQFQKKGSFHSGGGIASGLREQNQKVYAMTIASNLIELEYKWTRRVQRWSWQK